MVYFISKYHVEYHSKNTLFQPQFRFSNRKSRNFFCWWNIGSWGGMRLQQPYTAQFCGTRLGEKVKEKKELEWEGKRRREEIEIRRRARERKRRREGEGERSENWRTANPERDRKKKRTEMGLNKQNCVGEKRGKGAEFMKMQLWFCLCYKPKNGTPTRTRENYTAKKPLQSKNKVIVNEFLWLNCQSNRKPESL